MPGTIAQLFREKGYGFIQAEDGRRVFFHASALGRRSVRFWRWAKLQEGQQVTFTLGLRAERVWASYKADGEGKEKEESQGGPEIVAPEAP